MVSLSFKSKINEYASATLQNVEPLVIAEPNSNETKKYNLLFFMLLSEFKVYSFAYLYY